MKKHHWKASVATLVAIFAMVASLNASATVMLFVDLPRLVELSDIVVQGQVLEQQTVVDDATGTLFTDTTVLVTERFHGETPEKIVFRQWGGEHEGKIATIPGDAKFEPYEQVVLFLSHGKHEHEKGQLFLTALGQSKFTVITSGTTERVVRDLGGLSFMDPIENTFEGRGPEVYELGAFVEELRFHIESVKGAN